MTDFTEALAARSDKLPFFDLYLERGRAQRQLGSIDQSIADISYCLELQKYSTKHKVLAGAYNELGLSLALKGLLEESVEKFSKAVELDPDHAMFYNNRGRSYTAMKSSALAFQDFNKALSLQPHDAQVLHNRGLAHLLEEDFEAAHDDFAAAIELAPGESEFHFSTGRAFFQQQRFEQARPAFARCLDLAPGNPRALFELARAAVQLGSVREAMEALDRLLEAAPAHEGGHRLRGEVLQSIGNHLDAIKSFESALRAAPQNAELVFLRGRSLLHLGDNGEAIKAFNAALQLDLKDPTVYKHLGQAYDAQRSYEKALYYFNFGLKKDPGNPDFLIERSKLYAKLGNYPAALSDLQCVSNVAPSAFIHFKIGCVLYKNQSFSEALDSLSTALEKNELAEEHRHVALYTMGLAFASLERFAEAIEPLSQAITLRPDVVVYFHERAKCYLLIDHFDLAVQDFSETIERQPMNAHAYFGRGFAYKALKEFRRAVGLIGRGF